MKQRSTQKLQKTPFGGYNNVFADFYAKERSGFVKLLLLVIATSIALSGAYQSLIRSYRLWQRKGLERVQAGGILVQTAVGLVEYQLAGKGPAVIYAHGTPGGYDQGIAFMDFIGDDQCTFISPSRPGYLRTPLLSGATPEGQADLYAALLDELGIEKASVIGFSGGGPSALQFAIRHPERCHSVVMIGAIVQRNSIHERIQAMTLGKRLMAQLVEALLISEPFIYLMVPILRRISYGKAVAGMFCSGAQYSLRKAGYENDFIHFAALEAYPLERITAPTLIIHGTKDEDVLFEDATLMAEKIPHVMLLAIEKGDHAAFYTSARTTMPLLRDFLKM